MDRNRELAREARRAGIVALLLAPLVAALLHRPPPVLEELTPIQGTLDAAQWSGRDLLFFIEGRGAPLRLPPRQGASEFLREAIAAYPQALTFRADAQGVVWDARDEARVFVAYEDLATASHWRSLVGRALALLLLAVGAALVITSRQLPGRPARPAR